MYLTGLLRLLIGLGILELYVALDISKAFDRVWHADLLQKLNCYIIPGLNVSGWEVFTRISCYTGVSQGSILSSTVLQIYINDLSDYVICNISIYADNTTLYSKFDQASDLWQQLELVFKLENLICETLWNRAWGELLGSMLEKLSWFYLTGLTTPVLFMWKWMRLLLWKNHLLRCGGCLKMQGLIDM